MSLVRLADGRIGDGRVTARVRRDGDTLVVDDVEGDGTDGFLDALADVVTSVSRLVDSEGRVLRVVSPTPVDAEPPVTLGRLEEAIRASWSAETSCDVDGWTSENPAYQHCDVTARVVQDYLGGEVLIAGVVLDGRRVDRHAWNRLSSGLEVDLTREQFVRGERFEVPQALTDYVGDTIEQRYEAFAARVRERLSR